MELRLLLSAGLLSGWLVCLLGGFSGRGAVHLLLLLGLLAVPWRGR